MFRMKRFFFHIYLFHFVLLLFGCRLLTAQQDDSSSHVGLVEDWSSHHLVFSNPGTEQDAWRNGKHDRWVQTVHDRRYLMQEIRRKYLWTDWKEARRRRGAPPSSEQGMQRDWSVPLTTTAGAAVADGMFPAKFTFYPVTAPNCTNDYVVYPINVAGSTTQANLLGVNNLYKTTCTGTIPNVSFAYFTGTGTAQTSPVPSEDGTKIAFVESKSTGSIFHVLLLGTGGNSGCGTTNKNPCNGSAYNTPVQPATVYSITGSTVTGPTTVNSLNNAIDYQVKLNGNQMNTRSSPFVDFQNDVAYVGDDNGVLHKITPIFNSTTSNPPKEIVTGGWPVTVSTGALLTGPVFDSGASQSIFVGTGSGTHSGSIYCVLPTGSSCATPSVSVGTGVVDPPILDVTNETLFAMVNNTGGNTLAVQTTTSLTNVVSVTLGNFSNFLHNGAFDNNYYNNPSTGFLYVCGSTASTSGTPTLYQIGFNSNGTMKSSNTGKSFPLLRSGNNLASSCSPFMEVYNPSGNSGAGQDLLFLSVPADGFNTGTPNCGGNPCVVSFDITNNSLSSSFFPSSAKSVFSWTGTNGTSALEIDGISSVSGASQLYYGNRQSGTGVQVSQSALQ